MVSKARPSISIPLQLAIFRRDKWLCHVCKRPVVFGLALRQLADLVPAAKVAYYNQNWRRDRAPLLDELGASVDHVEAFSRGGQHAIDNFATICARCNARKSTKTRARFIEESNPWTVRGKHGEPTEWDGLTSVFVALAAQAMRPLTVTERRWLQALQADVPTDGAA